MIYIFITIVFIAAWGYLMRSRKTIVIHKGTHSPFYDFAFHLGRRSYKRKVNFTKSCLYNKIDREGDWNKLFGWSYGLHHKNSIRIAWRRTDLMEDQLELALYMYIDGERVIKRLAFVNVEEWVTIKINVSKNDVFSEARVKSGLTYPIWHKNNFKVGIGYWLFPYFGGQATAPHKMKIKFK